MTSLLSDPFLQACGGIPYVRLHDFQFLFRNIIKPRHSK